MLIIFGFRRTARRIAVLLLFCRTCGQDRPTALDRLVTKFTLFFVPLFPVRVRRVLTCAWCGSSSRVRKAEASRMLHAAPRVG